MTYRWVLHTPDRPELIDPLRRQLNDLPEALARALVLRGIETFEDARTFFRPAADTLHDPFLMQDMDAAADRLAEAITTGERVLVYGDYDVDGTTSTTLMTRFLREQGVEATYFIPDRYKDGYGLGPAGLDQAAAHGATLVVALDCGVTAHAAADYARDLGLDLIICDHHTALDTVPEAVAVLDPKRRDCRYPFKELCGCGVGFKLVQATLHRLGHDMEEAWPFLDLVAVATASDIVPVYGENRVLLREGFRVLREQPRLGLRALAKQARLDLASVTDTQALVFSIGPRINAAGRLGDAERAVALLLTDDRAEADRLARELEDVNGQRRALDRTIRDEALRLAERHLSAGRQSIVLHKPDWHLGVIGIVASRLVERFHRPAVLMTTANGALKGSARSITGLNVYDALTHCADLLDAFGGHDYAAGVTVREENLSAFQARFDEAIQDALTPELLTPSIAYDADLSLDAVGQRFWNVLKQFAPHGPDNDTPVFRGTNLEVTGTPKLVGGDQRHLKFSVRQDGPGHRPLDVIGFGLHKKLEALQTSQRTGMPVELLFSIDENTWRGRTSLQLRARDVRLAEG